MIGLPIRLQLRTWLQRVNEWYSSPEPLDEVQEVATIGDHTESLETDSRLPDGWSVDREMVQFRGESLAEVVRLASRGDGFRITLKPVDLQAPTEAIEVYTCGSPFEARSHRATVEPLSTAIDEAERLAVAHERRARQSTGRRRRAAKQ
jgi:hypothetical protein